MNYRRLAFRMKLKNADLIDEYRKRHDEIWPEIKNLLKYNVIHQEETARYEAEIAQIKQECRAEISTYQQTYSLTVHSL